MFNIKGNNYRLIVKINYSYRMIYLRFVGYARRGTTRLMQRRSNMSSKIRAIWSEPDYDVALARIDPLIRKGL